MKTHSRGSRLGAFTDSVVSFLAGEWILEWTPYTANGGTVVAARTLWLTFWIYIPAFLLRTALGEDKVFAFDLREGLVDFVDTLPWLAAVFAGIYIAFYTRFSSQWTYLADLYNNIVQAQLTMPFEDLEKRSKTLAAWKAGFIEDAEDLHLAAKPMFLVAVRHWGKMDDVSEAYARNTVGGARRLAALLLRLDLIWAAADTQAAIDLPQQPTIPSEV